MQALQEGIRHVFLGRFRRTLLLLLLVAIAPAVLLDVVHQIKGMQDRSAEEFQNNLELARSVGATFDAYIQDLLRQEASLGLVLASDLPTEQANQLLASTAKLYPSLRVLAWTDPQGLVLASSDPAGVGRNFGTGPFFQAIAQGRESVVSDLLQGQSEGKPTFAVSRGVRDGQGRLLGVVGAMVDATRLGEVLAFERFRQGAFIIIDSRGLSVYRYPEVQATWEQRDLLPSQPIIARALAGEETTGTIHAKNGQNRMGGWTPIRSIGWVASASREEGEVIGPLSRDVYGQVGMDLMIAALALVVALFVARNVTVPIRRLREHALAVGSGDLNQHVEVSGPQELKELGYAFNRMAGQITDHEKQREGYIHTVSHDLRSPLTVIQAQAQFLQRALVRTGSPVRERQSAEAIITSARRMNAVIQDLVDWARLESGQLQLERQPIDLGAFLPSLFERTAPVMDVGRISFDVPVHVPNVHADPNRLERILLNLLSNALKYSPDGSDVLLKTDVADGRVAISVADSGAGIAPEDLPHIFDRFYKGKNGRKGGGLGLGLYITRIMVEAHGGEIRAESEPGYGSRFRFTLPVHRGQPVVD